MEVSRLGDDEAKPAWLECPRVAHEHCLSARALACSEALIDSGEGELRVFFRKIADGNRRRQRLGVALNHKQWCLSRGRGVSQFHDDLLAMEASVWKLDS